MIVNATDQRAMAWRRLCARCVLCSALLCSLAAALLSARPAAAQAPSGIVAPATGATVRGLITITGVADHANFRKWQLDLLENGDPALAHNLAVSETPAPSLITFQTFDTTILPDGAHLLRLRVVFDSLNYDEYYAAIQVANQSASAPAGGLANLLQLITLPGAAQATPAATPEASPTPTPTATPAPLLRTDAPDDARKWIEVDIGDQTLTAWQGDMAVMRTSVSTGKPGHRTLPGTFAVYLKYEQAHMVGEDYDTPDVPWTMYYSGDFAIHGAYWHNNFGTPVSHGCVNLRVDEAKALYEWAPMGTEVVVHA